MNTDQLEALIEGGEETDTLEFKGAVAWDKHLFVKDILALANTVDGGRIVVGIEDGTFNREGLSQDQLASFDIDVMRDQIAAYADPQVIFRRLVVLDRVGLTYVVIEVLPFEELPVICKKGGKDVHAGEVYFRSRAARPMSARVGSSSDMREIIETSVARRLQALRRVGLVAVEADQGPFDQELGDLQ